MAIWYKPTPIKRIGGGTDVERVHTIEENRVDTDAIKVLMKYDSTNSWHKFLPDWVARSYECGDLETIAFLYPLAKTSNISVRFNSRAQRYLIDPFLSDKPLDLCNNSHIYIPGSSPQKDAPSLFAYRNDDNARIRELKGQIQKMLNEN